MSMMHCSLLSLGCAFGFSTPQESSLLTALRALKIAQRRLRPEVRTKLLSAISARTDQSMVPEAWRFIFLDPATSGNCRIVTVAAKTSSEHPDTVEAFAPTKPEEVATSASIAQKKIVIDSDQALNLVRVGTKRQGIKAAEYHLSPQKGNQEPLWTILFYAESSDPSAIFRVGAKNGTVEQAYLGN
jgi:hypothetical protein